MAYIIRNPLVGHQQITETSTTQKHPLGTVVDADDATRGSGKFIYLKGVASTVVGSVVTYNADDWSTALITANAIGPVAVAMSANVASQYGWYQVFGKASMKAGDVADDASVYIDTVDGQVDDAVVAGDRVQGAKFASVDDTATNLADAEIAWPFVDDALESGS